ncbi:hypothetical protein DPEC_G00090790 [Dallia pectoralis]|uniref:Uncharacterized protein n=1 Tax=Dallia pectoralis TaxID=75939 RepID=A0ACC2H1R6_DALPE|nr:hypothetical protein DPEC_G00090790 [Dallia pectoralis]
MSGLTSALPKRSRNMRLLLRLPGIQSGAISRRRFEDPTTAVRRARGECISGTRGQRRGLRRVRFPRLGSPATTRAAGEAGERVSRTRGQRLRARRARFGEFDSLP